MPAGKVRRECGARRGVAKCETQRLRAGSQSASTFEDDPEVLPLPPDPNMSEDLQVTATVAIPRAELVYRASRSGGAGGQHVNTSSTRIELMWDFAHSAGIDDTTRARIAQKLGARLDSDGMVRVVAGNRRSQLQNRIAAEERLVELVAEALHVAKKRKRTKPTRASKEKRLTDKKRRAERKRDRRDSGE